MNTLAFVAALAIFVVWARLVQPLHVVETFIGLLLAAIAFGFIRRAGR